MNWQQLTRRTVLGAAVVLVAASLALGGGHEASAARDDGGYPIDGYVDEEEFKLMCELYDGTFSKDQYGDTSCHYADGSSTHCDAYGQDCWRIPARQQQPGVEQTYDETGPMVESPGEPAPSGSATRPHTEPLVPVVDTITSPDAQPVQEPIQEAGAVMMAPVAEQP